MGEVHTLRPAPALVVDNANTPHRRLADALRRLSATGLDHTADMALGLSSRAMKFPLPDGRPHPEYVALAMKELASVPSELPSSYRHACSAARALMELAFPEVQPTQNGAA
jgi:hypothetical protein